MYFSRLSLTLAVSLLTTLTLAQTTIPASDPAAAAASAANIPSRLDTILEANPFTAQASTALIPYSNLPPGLISTLRDLVPEVSNTSNVSPAVRTLADFIARGRGTCEGVLPEDCPYSIPIECLPCVSNFAQALPCIDEVFALSKSVLPALALTEFRYTCDIYGQDVCACQDCVDLPQLKNICAGAELNRDAAADQAAFAAIIGEVRQSAHIEPPRPVGNAAAGAPTAPQMNGIRVAQTPASAGTPTAPRINAVPFAQPPAARTPTAPQRNAGPFEQAPAVGRGAGFVFTGLGAGAEPTGAGFVFTGLGAGAEPARSV